MIHYKDSPNVNFNQHEAQFVCEHFCPLRKVSIWVGMTGVRWIFISVCFSKRLDVYIADD